MVFQSSLGGLVETSHMWVEIYFGSLLLGFHQVD